MYLAGTTRGGAGGTGTLVVCAGCSCSACGGGTGFVGSLTVCCRCASAGETRTVESIRRSRGLLTFFIPGLPFRRGETFACPLETQLAERALPNQRFFQHAQALALRGRASGLQLSDDGLDERDGERAGVRQDLREVVQLHRAARAAVEPIDLLIRHPEHVLPDGHDPARHAVMVRPRRAAAVSADGLRAVFNVAAPAPSEEEHAEQHALFV